MTERKPAYSATHSWGSMLITSFWALFFMGLVIGITALIRWFA